jgi:hypothetical protein
MTYNSISLRRTRNGHAAQATHSHIVQGPSPLLTILGLVARVTYNILIGLTTGLIAVISDYQRLSLVARRTTLVALHMRTLTASALAQSRGTSTDTARLRRRRTSVVGRVHGVPSKRTRRVATREETNVHTKNAGTQGDATKGANGVFSLVVLQVVAVGHNTVVAHLTNDTGTGFLRGRLAGFTNV